MVFTLMAHHKSLNATFAGDAPSLLSTLNQIASSAVLTGPQPNRYFAALLTNLAYVPDIVVKRGEDHGEPQADTYRTLVIKCLRKLLNVHFRAEVRTSPVALVACTLTCREPKLASECAS